MATQSFRKQFRKLILFTKYGLFITRIEKNTFCENTKTNFVFRFNSTLYSSILYSRASEQPATIDEEEGGINKKEKQTTKTNWDEDTINERSIGMV